MKMKKITATMLTLTVMMSSIMTPATNTSAAKKDNVAAHKAYKIQLKSCAEELGDLEYVYKDLNADGIDELIIYPGFGYWTESIYTYYNGNCEELLCLAQGDVEKYYPGVDILQATYGHMGVYTTDYYKIQNGKALCKASVVSTEVIKNDKLKFKKTYYTNGKKVKKAKFDSYVKKLIGNEKAKSLNYSKIKWKKYTN